MPGKVFDVLNEVVVDRGSNPYLSKIECYEHNHLITKVRCVQSLRDSIFFGYCASLSFAYISV
jgi:hypothetical protein